jgi:hypothetical protein
MANYAVDFQRTASTTASVFSLTAESTTVARRMKVYDFIFGSEATPADAAILWTVNRCTTEGTGTSVTHAPLDTADSVSTAIALENLTIEPTHTASTTLLNVALNQRATFRWVAAPGGEIVIPATDENGIACQTDTISTGTPVITSTVHWAE